MVNLVNQWRKDKGFILQDIDNPSVNFPTTGMNNAFFNLTLVDMTASDISYEATPANSGLHLSISGSGNVAKVMLTGPKSGATAAEAATAVPTTFTLYTNDNGRRMKLYSFKVNQWFIASADEKAISSSDINRNYDENYCNRYGTGYRIPHIAELTNANGTNYGWFWAGSLGSRGTIFATRQIGGGLFSEWGNLSVESRDYYPNTDFPHTPLPSAGRLV
ncbi:hypothetical protein PT273_03235 [Orbaceae bacterium ESL0727]|nr:hypothetical protein [Orbaceae bacterium ESL0727]